MRLNKNLAAKYYCYNILFLIFCMIIYVSMWIQNYPLHECTYCINFEIQRKIHDFIELILVLHTVILPLSIVFGLKDKK